MREAPFEKFYILKIVFEITVNVPNNRVMKLTVLMVAMVGVTAVLPSQAQAQDENAVEAALQARRAERWPVFGVMADAGLPDGAIASLVVRPWQWVRAYAGGGSNSISHGWRGGMSLIPFGAGPSLSVEYGHYNEGDANGLVRRVVSGSFSGSPLLDRVGYDYANAHVGLEFGGKRFTFFVHGGVSQVWAQVHNLNTALQSTGSSTTIQVNQDPKVKVFGSSLKVGLILFLL
jgi:hypothetical protein